MSLFLKKIETKDDPSFLPCWDLYCSAFPLEERRELDYHLETMQSPYFSFDAIYEEEKLVGFIGLWEFESTVYVEHLAIFDNMRNGGYGRKVLAHLIENTSKTILLEVEHPEEEIQYRRINFYKQQGFVMNDHFYAHPSYHGEEPLELLIMTYPEAISSDELDQFKEKNFPRIHFRYTK